MLLLGQGIVLEALGQDVDMIVADMKPGMGIPYDAFARGKAEGGRRFLFSPMPGNILNDVFPSPFGV